MSYKDEICTSHKDETCTIIDKCNSADKLLNGGLAVLNLNVVLLLIFIDTSDEMNLYLPSRNIIFQYNNAFKVFA